MEENKKQLCNQNCHEKCIGHCWQVHESKSRPGWKYYYNIETNESQWMPCEAQGEKEIYIKYTTQKQHTFNKTHYPYPKGGPPKDVSNKSGSISRAYNQQVTDYQFMHQNYSISACENTARIYNPVKYINAVPVNISNTPTHNSEVWAVPPATQFIVTPAVTPLINQQQLLLDQSQVMIPFNYNNLPKNILTPTVGGLTNGSINIVHGTLQKFQTKPYKSKHHIFNRRPIMHKKFNPKRNIDLRQNHTTKEYYMGHDSNFYSNKECDESISSFEELCEDATKQNHQGTHKYLETSQQLDLTVLKDLATSNVNPDQWYIVADKIAIQDNFNFLNNLIDSDNSCRIMVPQCVFTELCTLTKDHNNINVRRIFRFLSEEIDRGLRWIGDNISNEEQNLSTFEVCQKLTTQKYHVVLVAGDREYLKLKNTTHIPIFTIQELKLFLKTKLPAESHIKISVDNNSEAIDNEQQLSRKNFSKFLSGHSFQIQHPSLPKPCNIDLQAKIVTKHCNIELQKSLDIVKPSIEAQPASHEIRMGLTYSNTDQPVICSSSIMINTNTSSTVSYKKRVIKLKHNEGIQQKCNYSNKGWSNKRMKTRGKNNEIPSSHNSISSKHSNRGQLTSDVLKDVKGSKNDTNSMDLLCDTSECTNDNNSKSHALLQNRNNIVIDETSTLISIPKIICDSDGVGTYQQKSGFASEEQDIKVMFEILDKNMEEYLIMRCDEWVSRFVQIMEEVLSQVLQQQPPFISKKFPPPWILQEAAQCVIKKFSGCFYVVDAANNLSIVIHKISDTIGKIATNTKPSDFMKMYSYGVYLVKALMNVCYNCEDLNNAAESLNKLLNDIQNHSIDNLNDTFTDASKECPIIEKDLSIDNNEEYSPDAVEGPKSTIEETLSSKNIDKCNIRSYKLNRYFKESEENMYDNNDDLEASFFSSLSLRKLNCSSSIGPNDVSEQNIINGTELEVDKTGPIVINEPNIIRQFSKCVEFEKRLKNQLNPMQGEVRYDSNEECSEKDKFDENLDLEDNCEKYESEISIDMGENNMKKFRCFIGLFVNEIREAFVQVQTLCKDFVASEHTQSKSDKTHVYYKAEKAHLYIDKLTKSLKSILNRDAGDPDKDIQTLMKKAGVDISFDQRLTAEYKSIITKCMDQAKEYLSYINLVITLNRDTSV